MQNQIIVYENGEIEIKVSIDSQNETIWLRTEDIALLFGVNRPAIVKHIGNIYKSNELEETLTCSILEQVTKDGKKRKVKYYNLDMIISIGYRVNSKKATKFRQWATKILKQYIINGYAINKLDLQKYNFQYDNLTIKISNKFHDRFLIIDDTTYHIGASLKDLGKKVFAFSKMNIDVLKDIDE